MYVVPVKKIVDYLRKSYEGAKVFDSIRGVIRPAQKRAALLFAHTPCRLHTFTAASMSPITSFLARGLSTTP